jgi:capsular polysaccharide biosynthesis protein
VEIAAFVSRRWRVIAALSIVPLGAAFVMAAVASTAEPRYRASIVVSVPSSGETASAQLQAMTDFRELVDTTAVADAVAEVTGQQPGAVRSGLEARQVGLSGLVSVQLDSPSEDTVVEGVQAATATALELLLSGDRAVAEGEVAAADAEIAELTAQASAVAAEAGHPLPRERYGSVTTELGQLRVAREQRGGDASAGGLAESIAALEAEEARLAPIVIRADAIDEQLAAARANRADAAQRIVVGQAELDAALNGLGEPTGPRRVSQRPAIVRAVVTALVLGTVVGALLLVLLELVGQRRPRSGPPSGGPSSRPAPDARATNGAGHRPSVRQAGR